MIVLYEPSGYPIKVFSEWYKAQSFVHHSEFCEPEMMYHYYFTEYKNIFSQIWIMYKYPALKF